MKDRNEFIGKQFDESMNKLNEVIAEMQTLGLITGDSNFGLFAALLDIIIVTAANNDMAELMDVLIPFIQAKADAELAREENELPKEIRDLLRGLDGSDPSKLN